MLSEMARKYFDHGYLSGIRLFDDQTVKHHCSELERAENEQGEIHYLTKVHTLFRSPYQLATAPQALDLVEQLIGPNILLFNVTYIIKEANSTSHVSWHQDLTYWGLSHDDQVSMWLALTPATEASGCMAMIPKSHKHGRLEHVTTDDASNVLLQGQTVKQANESESVLCPLESGEASFHHGWTLHASSPNTSSERRVGLNVQYIAPHVRQTKHDMDTAMLVRGEDQYHHFGADQPAVSDFSPDALKKHASVQKLYRETAGTQ